jgi:hypothetical protein
MFGALQGQHGAFPPLLAERRRRGVGKKVECASTYQPENLGPDRAPGLRPARMREQPDRPKHCECIKTSKESNHSSEASGATLGGCARAHPPE